MTDEELIARLRTLGRDFDDWGTAADRIEQLVATNEQLIEQRGDLVEAQKSLVETLSKSGRKRKDAEVKIAKAVHALRLVVTAKGLTDPIEHGYENIVFARAVLEELEEPE